MLEQLIGALVAGTMLALIYGVLHVAGPMVPWPEYYARALYYGIGFACFLIVGWGWAAWTGQLLAMFGLTIIGGCGGVGMLTAYVWEAYQERRAQATTAAEWKGTPPDETTR